MTHGLQARTAERRIEELEQRKHQAPLTFIQKVRSYELQPSSEKALWSMKQTSFFTSMNKPFNDRDYISGGTVGYLLPHMHNHRPANRSLWIEKYFQDYPYASFMALAIRISEELQISQQDALDILFIRTIIEPWYGYESEVMAYNLILALITKEEAKGFDAVRYATQSEDTLDGLDLILTQNNIPVYGFQVKPPSYFRGTRYLDTKIRNKNKNLNYVQRTGAKVFYLNSEDIRNGILRCISLAELDRVFGLAA